MMLIRSWAAPSAGARQAWTRGISCIVTRPQAPNLFDRNAALPLPAAQTIALVQDTGRSFSCAFPGAGAHVISPSYASHRSLYAFYIQSASKASVPRDPERPKRPLSAFFRFGAHAREKQGLKDAVHIGQAWSKLTPAEKQPFVQAAAAEKEAYDRKFEEYKASGKLESFKRDPAKPKKPLTPFFNWAMQERKAPHLANLSAVEASKALGVNWSKVPAETKAPLQTQFEAEMQQYNAKMKDYKESGGETAWLERTGRLEIIKRAEAQRQAQKDKIRLDKEKLKAKSAKEKEKEKAIAAKEREKGTLRKAKMKAAKDRAKEKERKAEAMAKAKVKAAADKAKRDAAAKRAKAKAALEKKKKAKAALDKKKAKEVLEAAKAKAKAKEVLEKKKAKAALAKMKAKEALVKKKAAAKAALEKKREKAAKEKLRKATDKAAKAAKAAKAKAARR